MKKADIFKVLSSEIEGEIYLDNIHKIIYSTDASAYREHPSAIIIPKTKNDILKTIDFARKHNLSIIPRAAGTSLAGQVVGNGIVVDISKYFNKINKINTVEKWVDLQPGVVLDELNKILAKDNLFFGPETSTSNRCMIGGMVGNNSSGAKSLIYGTTREHIIELECILSDGSEVVFKELTKKAFENKCKLENIEGEIYRHIKKTLENPDNASEIRKQFPNPALNRRNTGYALDLLLNSEIFSDSSNKFNFCKLLAGSEGTLAFITRIKLNLVDLPPKNNALVCVHAKSLQEVFEANLIALKYSPDAVELMDKIVLDLTKNNISQNRNRFFIEGDPEAILIVEWAKQSIDEVNEIALQMIREMKEKSIGYSYPIIYNENINKVWTLRKAGLGILSNMPGDEKPVPVIEDVAVTPEQLPHYIAELNAVLEKHNVKCVYYAHIGAGELHTRPILNLKSENGKQLFRTIASETAKIVKKYNGSLSGEHGDGRLRGEFIPHMTGEKIYGLFKELKTVWDPNNTLNANKITDTPPMNSYLRYESNIEAKEIDTYFDFSENGGLLRSAEKCNGSGDCRKSHIFTGAMCPSFQATKDEKHSTRARANILREIITYSGVDNALSSKEVFEVFDLCLLCKACKSECPSNVDAAKLKMEFLQHYYDNNHIPLRTKIIAYLPVFHKIMSVSPGISNYFLKNILTGKIIKGFFGFSNNRTIPVLSKQSLSSWKKKNKAHLNENNERKTVIIFNDEFTNYLDSHIGISAVKLFMKLGYIVQISPVMQSARTYLSKGLIRTAQKIINKNIEILKNLVSENAPMVGIEPSAVLSFRDEYPDLVFPENRQVLQKINKHIYLYDEFIAREIDKGQISSDIFTKEKKKILFHGHCQQKALVTTEFTHKIFKLIENYDFEEIPSGCCGMAGSFGYEREHEEISKKIAELVLFPAVRRASSETVLAATGTSCRCQIKDGTGKEVFHPIEILEKSVKYIT